MSCCCKLCNMLHQMRGTYKKPHAWYRYMHPRSQVLGCFDLFISCLFERSRGCWQMLLELASLLIYISSPLAGHSQERIHTINQKEQLKSSKSVNRKFYVIYLLNAKIETNQLSQSYLNVPSICFSIFCKPSETV